MRPVGVAIITVTVALAAFFTWKNFPEVKSFVQDTFVFSRIRTLEMRYTADTIMKDHRRSLLADKNHNFLDPDIEFHPYLLMEVKYNRSNNKTAEGVILWSLVDGEMVLDTKSWEKTHGFADCLSARADREDFKLINVLGKEGKLDFAEFSKRLKMDSDHLHVCLEKCKMKNLIVQNGNLYRLHIQDPKIFVVPETKFAQWFVTKASKVTHRLAKKYRSPQIITLARAAFGSEFTIRKTTEVFLPVHCISVQNPDGSQMTTYWNALNGKQFDFTYHIE